ncbi:MAG: cation:proton antiporter [Candidatus Woesearchaeota archaeon]
MENYIIYLFYLSTLLVLGILATAVSNKFRLSNILFLVLIGYGLKSTGLDFFDEEIILVLSALALILIVLETTIRLELTGIMKNFIQVLKYNIVFLIISSYIITLSVYVLFDIPGKGFEVFILCLLLSFIIYGIDPIIATEFFPVKKSKVHDILEIEGILSGPIVVIFSFFVIDYLNSSISNFTIDIFSTLIMIIRQVGLAVIIGIIIAFVVYKLIKNYPTTRELSALFIITIAILTFVIGEIMLTNATIAVAVYGIMLKGLLKDNISPQYTSMISHILYIIVFILFGIEFFFPEAVLWLKGIALFIAYLVLRFMCILLFMKELNYRQKFFMTFNVAKGIEVALIMFIMKINFSHIEGINLILSIGFMFFVFSYIVSTLVNHFNEYFIKERSKIEQ